MIELGKMEKIVDLRTVWKHEAQDFSKWLSREENLAILSRTIGIDIVFNEVESKSVALTWICMRWKKEQIEK